MAEMERCRNAGDGRCCSGSSCQAGFCDNICGQSPEIGPQCRQPAPAAGQTSDEKVTPHSPVPRLAAAHRSPLQACAVYLREFNKSLIILFACMRGYYRHRPPPRPQPPHTQQDAGACSLLIVTMDGQVSPCSMLSELSSRGRGWHLGSCRGPSTRVGRPPAGPTCSAAGH